jgi:hypothetical protein
MTINDRVKRWDVYDVADELADVPWMLQRLQTGGTYRLPGMVSEIRDKVEDLERRLWEAAERGGTVGPSPLYEQVELEGPVRGAVFAWAFSVGFWLLLALAGWWLVLHG